MGGRILSYYQVAFYHLSICLSLLKNLGPESGVKRVLYFCLKSMYSFFKILFCKILNIEFSCTRRQSRIFDPSHWYWRPATVTRDEPRLRDVRHCIGQSLLFEKKHRYLKNTVTTVLDTDTRFSATCTRRPVTVICQTLYETSSHQYPWLVTGVFFHIYIYIY